MNEDNTMKNLQANLRAAQDRREWAAEDAAKADQDVMFWAEKVREEEDRLDALNPLAVGDVVEYKKRASATTYEVLGTYINQNDPHDRVLKIVKRYRGRRAGGLIHLREESKLQRVRR